VRRPSAAAASSGSRASGCRSPVVHALALVKRSAARVNLALGLLEQKKAEAIGRAADEVLAGKHDEEFPLVVWQTGSGTQSNMNVNEVLANRASELMGEPRGRARCHPNDDVNLCQSSNDVFPTAMHVAAARALRDDVLPAIGQLAATLREKREEFDASSRSAARTCRTRRRSRWARNSRLRRAAQHARRRSSNAARALRARDRRHRGRHRPERASRIQRARRQELLPRRHAVRVRAQQVRRARGHEALLFAHGALKTLAAALTRSRTTCAGCLGPALGLGEISIPENEPGSSIMPGKVNPTQAEALTMACAQVSATTSRSTSAARPATSS
jgi:fumarate hydratase class II